MALWASCLVKSVLFLCYSGSWLFCKYKIQQLYLFHGMLPEILKFFMPNWSKYSDGLLHRNYRSIYIFIGPTHFVLVNIIPCLVNHFYQLSREWAIPIGHRRPAVVCLQIFHISSFSRTAWWVLMKIGRDEVLMIPYKCCGFSASPGRCQNRSGGVPSSKNFLRLVGYNKKLNA